MKKIYMKPETEALKINVKTIIMTSPNTIPIEEGELDPNDMDSRSTNSVWDD